MFRISTVIRNGVLFCVLPVTSIFAQQLQFQLEIDTIPVIINGGLAFQPFGGAILSSQPTFSDIDNDGDLDLFVGNGAGNINFYRNTGTTTNPSFTPETKDFASIDIGLYSAPAFADIDNDGDLDLCVGEFDGNINFYRNTGTPTNPAFTLETENLASIDVGNFSALAFLDIDNDGDFDLFVGESAGNINFYRNTGTPTNPTFILETENLASIDVGTVSAPAFADIDNDGDWDLFVGGLDATINFYRNTGTVTNFAFTLVTENLVLNLDVGSSSAPAFVDIDNDGDFDLFVGESDGNINFYRNIGTATNPTFTFETAVFDSIDVGDSSDPTFADIDGDEDFDLFVGKADGTINFYQNTGTVSNPFFALITQNLASDVGFGSSPAFADIDNDGDLDLFVGETNGNIYYYQNTGTASNPILELITERLFFIDVGDNSALTFVDIDNDGDFDFFVGENAGNINFFRNTGTARTFIFTLETENLASIDVGGSSDPALVDIDHDGDFDLFVGEFAGGLHFYRNVSPRPTISLSETSIDFDTVNVNSQRIDTLVIENIGNADLIIATINFSNSSTDFSLVSPTSYPVTIAPSDSLPVIVRFSPSSEGEKRNTLNISSNDPQSTNTTVILVGIGNQEGQILKAPEILFVKDVPYDQGGNVTVKWIASSLDTIANVLPFYSIWRALPEGVQAQTSIISAKEVTLNFEETAYRVEMFNGNNYTWEWLANQPAHGFPFYTYTAATLYDSMSTTDGKHYFLVSAHTNDPNVFYDSMPDSGYSVDNLAPIAPRNLVARHDSGMVVLHWNPVTATDLRQYLVYRSSSPNINPDILPHFATSKDTMFLDTTPLSGTSYYAICAQDIHDNRSLKSNEVAVIVTQVNEPKGKIPIAYILYQNHPNPFNPSTKIRYAIPTASYVTLKVYNLLGKEIERLVDGKQPVGEYEIQWNPVDLPSGVYIYKLQAGEFAATKKLILMK